MAMKAHHPALDIRQLTTVDLSQVLRIQAACFLPQLHEREDSFRSKLLLFPQGSLGCFCGLHLAAYVCAFPWRADAVVAFDSSPARLPDQPDAMYVHDLAVAPEFRGKGCASRLIQHVFRLGRSLGYRHYVLVAVQSSESFWNHYGFVRQASLDYPDGMPAARMLLIQKT